MTHYYATWLQSFTCSLTDFQLSYLQNVIPLQFKLSLKPILRVSDVFLTSSAFSVDGQHKSSSPTMNSRGQRTFSICWWQIQCFSITTATIMSHSNMQIFVWEQHSNLTLNSAKHIKLRVDSQWIAKSCINNQQHLKG